MKQTIVPIECTDTSGFSACKLCLFVEYPYLCGFIKCVDFEREDYNNVYFRPE